VFFGLFFGEESIAERVSHHACQTNHPDLMDLTTNSGPAHVVVLNPYTDSNLTTSRQGKWLQADIAAHKERQAQRLKEGGAGAWLVVMMHCPWYNSNTHHNGEFQAVAMKASLESYFLDVGVDVVLAGTSNTKTPPNARDIAYSRFENCRSWV
jgi:hypothetical protein